MFFWNPFARIHRSIHNLGRVIMATQAEHAQALRDLKAQNERARAESQAAFKKLQDALDAGTTAEVDAAMAELGASIQADDDTHPPVDPPAEPPADPPTP